VLDICKNSLLLKHLARCNCLKLSCRWSGIDGEVMVAMLSNLMFLCSCKKFSWWFSLALMVVGDQCPCNLLKVPLFVSRLLVVFVVGWCSQSDSCCRCVAILFLSYVVGDLSLVCYLLFSSFVLEVYVCIACCSRIFFVVLLWMVCPSCVDVWVQYVEEITSKF
jgi:hypothetical protein